MRRYFLFLQALLATTLLLAQIPAGYYDRATGKKASDLKTAMCAIINPHTNIGYDGLWSAYKKTDLRPDGKIWDMYSDNTNYDPDAGHKGNYSKEGDMFNREHSVPQSWFSEASPMKADIFHVYPTDGYVNNRRSNHPFGEVSSPTYTSHGGFCKLGKCSVEGYSGTVFEPADEYKGDFARTYFYMATCYENQIGNWKGDVFGRGKYPGMAGWCVKMFLRWAKEDPVSQKEIDRNNAAYKLQGNRNPFIDYPSLCEYIWGDSITYAFDSTQNHEQGEGGGGGEETKDPVITTSLQKIVLSALPSAESESQALAVKVSNLEEPELTATITSPFEISDDKVHWEQSVSLSSDNCTFYIHIPAQATEGTYTGTLTLTCQGCTPVVVPITAVVASRADFIETFETGTKGNYTVGTVVCTQGRWSFNNALMGSQSNDKKNGKQAPRIKGGGYIELDEDKPFGCGMLTLYAGLYGSDTGMAMTIAYSTNGGSSWVNVASNVTLGAWTSYSYPINKEGNIRIRITATGASGDRINVDDIKMTDYSTNAIDNVGESTSQQDNEIYNLSGQRITHMQRGINIIGGKKVVR